MAELRDIIDRLCEEIGIHTPKKIIEARVFVNHQFPDLISRQAFLGAMVSDMCEEFDVDRNSLLDFWKEVL